MKYIKPLVFAIILIVLDQLTKVWAVATLAGNEGIKLIPGVFRLLYLENRGSAFGMMQGRQTFFFIFTVIVLIGLVFIYPRIPDVKRMIPLKIVAVLIFAGAIGNFIDRIRQSYVVDFFYFELIDFPIFNVADIYVTCSAFILMVLILFYYKEDELDFIGFKKK